MQILITPASIILFANGLLLSFLAYYIFTEKREVRGSREFTLLMISASFWAFLMFLESLSLTLNMRILWSKISYVGIVTVPGFWLFFVLKYIQADPKIIKKLARYYWIIPLATLALTFTNEAHNLIWKGYVLIGDSISQGVNYLHGTFFLYSCFLLLYVRSCRNSIVN